MPELPLSRTSASPPMSTTRPLKIVGAEIQWNDEWANEPVLHVITDGWIPRRPDLRYEEIFLTAQAGLSREQDQVVGARWKQDLHILYAEAPGGFVDFVQVGHETPPRGGMGGDFILADGRELHVKSGWTIGSTAIRERADVVECWFRTDPNYRALRSAGWLKTDRVREVVAEFLPDVEMYDDWGGWSFRWRGGPTKREWHASAGWDRPYSKWPEVNE